MLAGVLNLWLKNKSTITSRHQSDSVTSAGVLPTYRKFWKNVFQKQIWENIRTDTLWLVRVRNLDFFAYDCHSALLRCVCKLYNAIL